MLHKGELVYLDLGKTGSTFLVQFLNDEVDGALRRFVKHEPPTTTTKESGQVWVMSVRDPLAYYVSLWSFGAARHDGVWFAFQEPLRARLYDTTSAGAFRAWVRALFAAEGLVSDREGRGKAAISVENAARSGVGLFTLRLIAMATSSPALRDSNHRFATDRPDDVCRWYAEHTRVDEVIRLERLRADLTRVLERAELTARPGARDRLGRAPAMNRSSHHDLEHYYDGATADLVRARDRFVYEQFYRAEP